MSLVQFERLNDLFDATQSHTTADTALDDIQIQTVAYAINTAANTGEYEVTFGEPLRPNVRTKLKEAGYSIREVGPGVHNPLRVISW